MSKADLLLLHGALGSKSQFSSLISLLEETFQIHTLDFEGHGSSPLRDRAFRDQHFAEDVLDYLKKHSLQSVSVFGYSMGGHVGLYLAKNHPERIHRIFTLATKYLWTPEIADREARYLDAERIVKKVPHFAKVLQERHAVSGWKNVLRKTKEMFFELGQRNSLPMEELRQIDHVVRIGVGDRDNMVSIEESVQVYRSLPRGELEIFPNTPHPLEEVPLSYLVDSMVEFFG
ncbi:MAG: alpha/beta fold hydrolase [Deltaproteobacteria bacterium]|nr:MAG: alpha/beta fold hydrolase [Deltaproteobacteria bacterium]